MATIFVLCSAVFSVLLGGLLVVFTLDGGDSTARWFAPQVVLLVVCAVAGLAALVRVRRDGGMQQLKLASAAALVLGVATLALCNAAASLVVPPWPARALHGVEPRVWAKAFENVKRDGPDVGFNSFGQRDRERSVTAAGPRVVLVGDSFLEEGSGTPLNLAMEAKVQGRTMEVVNLGVSATAPDEYFYRTRNVALPLGASHVMVFVYAGNDFINVRTLRSMMGVTATYPRDSLLSVLGMQALSHVSMNWRRPILGAWGNAGQELDAERALHAAIASETDAQLVERFARHVEEPRRPALRARLEAAEARTFFEMLRHPDGGNFRSYFIWPALESAAGMTPPPVEGVAFTTSWVQRVGELCQQRGVHFTAVLVPEAFAVDDRMVEQYAPIANLRQWTAAKKEALQTLGASLKASGFDVVDLHTVLGGTRGTYLNMDGHWSAAGVDLVAAALVERL